ncbi:MAG TPA: hypothetical protein VFD32_14525 [Dehalococcoidia bacterium]|nr:hypothetical protein [Dehalococcoidia bacterium]
MSAAHRSGEAPRGVTAHISGPEPAECFHGAAVLRMRPHPLAGAPSLQLGVPDDALGFRPRPNARYSVEIEEDAARYSSHAVWLERVQSSWWFVLDAGQGIGSRE